MRDPVGVDEAGVYLYHMPMGRSGVAKADNFHGWGHRFSSFWWAFESKRIGKQICSQCQLWRIDTKGLPTSSAARIGCRLVQVLLWHGC